MARDGRQGRPLEGPGAEQRLSALRRRFAAVERRSAGAARRQGLLREARAFAVWLAVFAMFAAVLLYLWDR
jgi:hypothetical protein